MVNAGCEIEDLAFYTSIQNRLISVQRGTFARLETYGVIRLAVSRSSAAIPSCSRTRHPLTWTPMEPPSTLKVSDFSNTRLAIPFLDANQQQIALLLAWQLLLLQKSQLECIQALPFAGRDIHHDIVEVDINWNGYSNTEY